MNPNPALGVLFHWLGGLASASFYVPYRGVKNWAWETYWLVGGFFSWIIVPWLLALTMTRDLTQVLRETPSSAIFLVYFFGVLWGLGGLTFGLTMRYLGMSLGMAVALGYTAAFGTLMPPIFRGEFATQVLGTRSGLIILGGVAVCLLGIAFAGAAGVSKEREMSEAQKRASIKEFDLKKGLLVATFSGVMSACFAYGLAAGDPIKVITVQHGTTGLWQGLPVLVVVLAGGFTTNFIWCVILNVRNQTGYQYFNSEIRGKVPQRSEETIIEAVTDAPGEEMAVAVAVAQGPPVSAPMLPNYLFSALAGTTWYMQFFFYTMGETQMGRYKFSSWTLHMASIIIFSTLWGIALKEWKGAGGRTRLLVG
jgi:L-rhamnose-H+ transport protein